MRFLCSTKQKTRLNSGDTRFPADQKFICILSFASLSVLELIRLKDSGVLKFNLLKFSPDSALIECGEETAKSLSGRAGGIFKVAKVCGHSVQELLAELPLPDEPKFSWTVSGYGCEKETLEDTRMEVAILLKKSSLGKSRYLFPDPRGENSEIKIFDLVKNVLVNDQNKTKGIDVTVNCDLVERYFGFTKFPSDVKGFEERDFGRPYQDPTVTMSPRLARTLVNLCGLQNGNTLLDPFCGHGTILQEALLVGLNVVGIDISSSEISKARENLVWLKKRFHLSPKLSSNVFRRDTLRMEYSNLPKADAIATEPILIPKLEKNQNASKSIEIIRDSSIKYGEAFSAFTEILRPGGLVAIVAPDLIDDRGKSHGIDIEYVSAEYGFTLLRSEDPGVQNPCLVPTTKRKIIQRKVYVMKFDPTSV